MLHIHTTYDLLSKSSPSLFTRFSVFVAAQAVGLDYDLRVHSIFPAFDDWSWQAMAFPLVSEPS